MTDLPDHALPHRRRNLLTGEWVLVSPQRNLRPWQGEVSSPSAQERPGHDPNCYLCPGNSRANGDTNPDYCGTWVFPNDFPALLASDSKIIDAGPLFQREAVRGETQVICYAPDHALSLSRMDDAQRRDVVECWCDLSEKAGADWAHVQIFENRGSMMGASSPHPHGQMWATDFLPQIVADEDAAQAAYRENNGRALLDDVLAEELKAGERLVEVNDNWAAFVPHWAAWPFETALVPRADRARLEELGDDERHDLAKILGRLLARYDGLFGCEFPYSMGWHGAPHGMEGSCDHWRLHAHFFPPLLRSASVRKHMVGFELMAETQRDMTAEQAAERLRAVAP
uniref:UDP-glucose--hexose-1-phosphate uridylyltransferase n=1 Tax=Parerythrobacter lutipelagi TaxID=1964208 RepID=UPI0010F5BD92|nr:UDP-glucose--hexose-1-phosphate uridylyltransferase [Parerythrobacter lutipelagi]